jgi:hypothetical protein
MAEISQPDKWEFFRQPGALLEHNKDGVIYYSENPAAENVNNQQLGYKYWTEMVSGKDYDWIRVHVLSEYGNIVDGRPVYPEFFSLTHIADEEIKPMRGLPLILGWDFGLTPACIFGQMTPKGQLIVLDELIAENMGIKQFAEQVIKPHIFNKYAGMKLQSWADPAGIQRAQTDEKTCIQILNTVGIPTEPSGSNNFTERRESVVRFMTSMRDNKSCFLINPSCTVLIEGFMGGYSYRRLQVSGENRYTEKPDKNSFSHPHDAG